MRYIGKEVRKVGRERRLQKDKTDISSKYRICKNVSLWKLGLLKPLHEVRECSLLFGEGGFVFKQSGGLIHRETNTNFVEK